MSKAFDAYRLDLQKADGGVWHTHPKTGDRFCIRRWGCAEFTRYQAQRLAELPEDLSQEQRAALARDRVSTLISGWELKSAPDLACTPEAALALVRDPELVDLVAWIQSKSLLEDGYRKAVAGALGN